MKPDDPHSAAHEELLARLQADFAVGAASDEPGDVVAGPSMAMDAGAGGYADGDGDGHGDGCDSHDVGVGAQPRGRDAGADGDRSDGGLPPGAAGISAAALAIADRIVESASISRNAT